MSATALIVGGLVLLGVGGEMLLRGAMRLSTLLGVSPLVVGLTVVAFGTSAPELSVSIMAASAGAGDVALGNVVGSTTFNVLGILGLSALVTPLVVSSRLIRIDVPLRAFAAALTLVLALDGVISRVDGLLLVAGLLAYLTFAVVEARRGDAPRVEAEFSEAVDRRARGVRQAATSLAWIVVGLVALVLGSSFLVDGAVAIARSMGVSEIVIGLTIVSVGTSLPEVAASVAAALRGERDIAIGNVVGSNLFNLLGVLGFSGLVARGGLLVSPDVLRLDLMVMLAACLACLPVFLMGFRISRTEGAVFLAYYAAYVAILVLRATGSPAAALVTQSIISIVLPLTIVVGAVAFVREMRERDRPVA